MRCITFSKLVTLYRRSRPAVWLLLGLLAGPLLPNASGQGTAFTYQGRLTDGSGPANGDYDFRLRLAADPLGNNLVAGPILTNAVPVSGGLFTVTLDFGSVFTGSNFWLQIEVRTNGAGTYSTLTPLQALTPAPYAIFAAGASNVLGAVPTAQLTGTVASPQLAGTYSNPLNFSNAANQFSGTFNGNGGALSNVNAATLGGLAASNFWQTAGNTGTTPSANFLGTTDNQPLEFRVNGQRVLRLTPNSNGGPNLLGGSVANTISPGVAGAVIIGGGSISYFGAPYTNSITSDFDFIGGGGGHSIGTNSPFSTIVGGTVNQIAANNSDAFIGGGNGNQIQATSGFSTISGGLVNQIGTNSSQATVGGGGSNIIGSNDSEATIGGGGGIRILDNSAASTIAGGSSNQILTNSTFATIAGGLVNQIRSFSDYSFLGGGTRNMITNSQYATLGGGNFNTIVGAPSAVIVGGNNNTNTGFLASIGGGEANVIQFAADHAVIAGGGNNTIVGSLTLPVFDTIGGGNWNTMQTNSTFSIIAGGQSNVVATGAAFSAISGGSGNVILNSAVNATIGGGSNNMVSAPAATVPGGLGNVASGPSSVAMGLNSTAFGFAAVAMGQNSVASGNYSLAAGFFAQATNHGAFVWGDLAGPNFSSTNDNSFNVRATGGVRLFTSGAGMSLDGPLGVTGGLISGNGGSLTNVNASALGGIPSSNFWQIGGNNVGSGQFLGSTNNQALEFKANSQRALRLEPNTNGAPNLIGGSPNNRVDSAAIGAFIGGGGATNYPGDFFVSAGPHTNRTGSSFSLIGGGLDNRVETNCAYSAITGGTGNRIQNGSSLSFISAGYNNAISNSTFSSVGGGGGNLIMEYDVNVIGGGDGNAIYLEGGATIGGGVANQIGLTNYLGGASFSGDTGNAIAGGLENWIQGGQLQTSSSFIGGGSFNVISNGATSATIAGGQQNVAGGNWSFVGGGVNNVAAGQFSFAAGQRADALHDGSFVWADSTLGNFASTGANQFLIRANGGVGIGKVNPATALDVNGVVTATSFSGSGAGLSGVAPASGSANYIQNQTAANQGAGFRITGNGIFNGGNVGIGTVSPSTALHVRDTGDTEISIQSNDTGSHRWTLQSSALTGSPSLDASFQIIDRTANDSRLLIGTNGFVGIANRSPTNVLDVTGSISCSANVYAHGVLLTSDRNAKENFATVNPETILDKVVSLPLTEWNYKGDVPEIKHVGPMAQDFRAAFGLNGNDDAHISAVDETGVALAAIQGLNQKLTEELRRRDAENAALKQRLERLEQLLEGQSHNH